MEVNGFKVPECLLQLFKNTTNVFLEDRYVYPIGSKFTCNPPVLNTDEDWMVFLPDGYDTQEFERLGWSHCLNGYIDGDFTAMRLGSINAVITKHRDIFENGIKGAKICTKLNLLEKEDRTYVFQVCRGEI